MQLKSAARSFTFNYSPMKGFIFFLKKKKKTSKVTAEEKSS